MKLTLSNLITYHLPQLTYALFSDSRDYHLAYWTEDQINTTLPKLQVTKMFARNLFDQRFFYLTSTLSYTVPQDEADITIQLYG
jgi:hypothetical protein